MADCLFCKIASGEVSPNADFILQNEDWVAFNDVNPKAPVHVLIIPRKHIASLNDATVDDSLLLGRMLLAVSEVAEKMGVRQSGYRLISNCGEDGGQVVGHLHFHVLGGTKIGAKGHEL